MAPIDKLSVVLVAILGALFLSEQPNVKNWMGVFIIAAGTVLVNWILLADSSLAVVAGFDRDVAQVPAAWLFT